MMKILVPVSDVIIIIIMCCFKYTWFVRNEIQLNFTRLKSKIDMSTKMET
jgi:hypothetical protein